MKPYHYEQTLEEKRKEEAMKVANFCTMAAILGANVFLAIICCTIIICKAMEPDVPEPEEITIQLIDPVNFYETEVQDEAYKHHSVVVAKLTSLGFEYDRSADSMTITTDRYELIQPKVEEILAEYAKEMR